MFSTPGLLGHKYLIYAQCSVIFSPLTHIPLWANKNMKQDEGHSLSLHFLSSNQLPPSCYWTGCWDGNVCFQDICITMNWLCRAYDWIMLKSGCKCTILPLKPSPQTTITFSFTYTNFPILTHTHSFLRLLFPSPFFSVAEAEPGSEWTTCGPLSLTLSPL